MSDGKATFKMSAQNILTIFEAGVLTHLPYRYLLRPALHLVGRIADKSDQGNHHNGDPDYHHGSAESAI